MPSPPPTFELQNQASGAAILELGGCWNLEQETPSFTGLEQQLSEVSPGTLSCCVDHLQEWDSTLMAFLLQCYNYCINAGIKFDSAQLPEGARSLLAVSTAVKVHERPAEAQPGLKERLNPLPLFETIGASITESLGFIGEVTVALGRLLRGKANSRREDFLTFIHQAGPDAFAIITLTSFLVGMILAYLGAAQLAQFGAQIYVADLVSVGMLREMGALMTAVVMAGRTGAAYAAQLGTMQTREEIDAVVTLGISPIEFLVLPRIIALVVIMPLLTLYANMIGILGGALVAAGMDVSLTQFIVQAQGAISLTHLGVGIFKGTVFGVLIAIAGCRAGMQCGRSSAAVGQAATEAVVTSIVYLIIADAAFNILFEQMGI
jgi:phospholipid/cholesterol/gamma-HCH transport system permease protein